MEPSRREFLAAAVAVAMSTLTANAHPAVPRKRHARRRKIYRLSVRCRRASNAAKEWCANMRFKTKRAAAKHPRPHPGINARIVPIDVSFDEFDRLFLSRHARWADLRQMKGVRIIGAR